jgi:ferric-dicitrate binding protein FerR (iron transport regulator)
VARHVDELLTAYVHNELHGTELERVDAHLRDCRECRQELERIRSITELLGAAPALRSRDNWQEIDRQLSTPARSTGLLRTAVAGALLVAIASFIVSRPPSPAPASRPGLDILDARGSVLLANQPYRAGTQLQSGQSLCTGDEGTTRLAIGSIGEVELKPNTVATLVSTGPEQHRLRLTRGEISAHVSAPPRLFVIETPAAEAVDLGCAYTLRVDDAGDTILTVTTGWVSLERDGTESMVPAGWSCKTVQGQGIGTPRCGTAPPAFRQALDEFDRTRACMSLERALGAARKADSLSLWHLLPRTTSHRSQVLAQIKKLVGLPSDCTQDSILKLDPVAMESLRQSILDSNPSTREPIPFGLPDLR